MLSDPDIVGAARLLIVRHGEDASIWVAERADEDLAREDDEDLAREDIARASMWHAIGRTIEELRRVRRADELLN